MSYRIRYPAIRKLRGAERLRIRLPALTAVCFLLFLLLIRLLWPEGTALLRSVFAPIQDFLPAAALDQFAAKLLKGDVAAAFLSDLVTSVGT